MTRRVCTSHTDMNGRLKLVSALDMMQDCSILWLESEPAFDNRLRELGGAMVIASRQINIARMPRYGERLTVRTSIYLCQRFYGHRNTVIHDEAGKPCVLSWCVGVFVDAESGGILKLPQEIIDTMTIDPAVEMEYLDKKITPPALDAQKLPPFPVRRHDIDFNRHMNNARYVEAAMEFLPDGFEPNRVRIEYKNAARLGDMLHPAVMRANDGLCFVILADTRGKPRAVLEFAAV